MLGLIDGTLQARRVIPAMYAYLTSRTAGPVVVEGGDGAVRAEPVAG